MPRMSGCLCLSSLRFMFLPGLLCRDRCLEAPPSSIIDTNSCRCRECPLDGADHDLPMGSTPVSASSGRRSPSRPSLSFAATAPPAEQNAFAEVYADYPHALRIASFTLSSASTASEENSRRLFHLGPESV